MKKTIIVLFILLTSGYFATATETGFNTPVSSSANLSSFVIKPLSVTPTSTTDYINWPTIPIGQKYVIPVTNEDVDNRSIFTFSGEPGNSIEITIVPQTEVDNVEISYRLKGTPIQYLGIQQVPILTFDGGRTIVNLNSGGQYFMHIIYDWVWAKDNATTGVKHFVQHISAQYNGL